MSIEGCVRRRNRRKSGHTRSKGFTIATQSDVAFGNCYGGTVSIEGCVRRRSRRKSRHTRSTGFTIAAQSDVAFGNCYRGAVSIECVAAAEGCVRRRNRRKSGHTRSTGFTFAAQSIATSRCSSATTGFVGAGFCLVRFDDDQQRARPDYSSYSARAFAQRETDGEQTDGSDTREKSDRA